MIRYPHALRPNSKFLAVTSTVILALILATFLPVRASAAGTDLVRLNMKSYGNHNATYDARIMEIKPQYVIDNPAHGLYGEMFGYDDSTLLQNVAGYQSAGIKVIGYITGGYEGAGGDDRYASKWYSLDMQKKLITNMANLDHVDGVFIDEISDYPNTASKAYLKELTSLAHSYGLITWGNTGVDQFDEWFFTEGGFDYMQSSENWIGQTLSAVQKKWGSRISVTGFNRNYTADDAVRLTLDAWNKGLAFCYINTVEYVSIASWFEQYASILRANGGTVSSTSPSVVAPTIATGTATGITVNGATLNGTLSSMGSSISVSISFEWGLTTSYGNTTAASSMTNIGASSAAITGLASNTTYHFRVKAVGSSTVYGSDKTFQTATSTTSTPLPVAPTVATGTATGITVNGATLNGTLSSMGSSISVSISFEWGLTTSYGNTTAASSMTNIGASSAAITGLASNTTYHFRVKAVGSSTVYGSDKTFQTATSTTSTPTSGNTTGTVVGTPKPSGGANEYNFSLKVTSTTVTGVTAGQQIWVAATTTDFPNLLTSGATLTGNLDKSQGWWVLKKASTSTPTTSTTVPGNTTATVASKPAPSGGSNEYNLYIKVTSTTVTGVKVDQQLWVAATTTDFPNLLTVGAVITGNLDHSSGWWILSKA